MDPYAAIAVIGGLAFFLFGMHVLSGALKKVAGERLEAVLQRMTDHPLKGMALGIVITVAMQSSSALTVMLVGLVNSGIMTLGQTVGVIMGSNIGTTLTAWLLSLSGLKTDHLLLAMLKPTNFSPILAFIGVCLIMAAKEERKRDIGSALVGFAMLMHGMEMMSDALSPLAELPGFVSALTAIRHPVFGVLIGTLFTATIQSSAASVGVLQAMSLTGHISYGLAIPIIMGQNIGTCVTALLSSIGVSRNAQRVSVIHIGFNLIGTAVGLTLDLILDRMLGLPFFDLPASPFAIAAIHSIFNIATTALLLPFSSGLVSLAERLIPSDTEAAVFLDKRLLLSPAMAVAECRRKSADILKKATEGYRSAMSLLGAYDDKKRETIRQMEAEVDEMVGAVNSFLIELSSKDVSGREGVVIADVLHGLGDMERISDYSLNLSTIVKKISRLEPERQTELSELLLPINTELTEIFQLTESSFEKKDPVAARVVLARTKELVTSVKRTKKADLKLLRRGEREPEASVYLSDYLSISRRAAEHAENIVEAML